MRVIMSASNQRTAGAWGRDFPDYFEGKQGMLTNQKQASFECETFEGFPFINLGGLGPGLGWLRRLWNTQWFYGLKPVTCEIKQKFEIFSVIIFCLIIYAAKHAWFNPSPNKQTIFSNANANVFFFFFFFEMQHLRALISKPEHKENLRLLHTKECLAT